MSRRVDAVLFDKDGTLFDFEATWTAFAAEVVQTLAGGDAALAACLAAAIGFDPGQRRYRPDSIVIAGTNREIAGVLAAELPGRDPDGIERYLAEASASAPLAEAVPLVPLLTGLAARDLGLGVMTNDSEAAARAQLRVAGIEGMFDFIAGADSGYGGKPSPLPLLAFARALRLPPDRVVMVGDSTHDLRAGRAAGMQVVAVLTGPASADALGPLADAVLPDIGHLPGWIAAES